jgi:hypothetical protein
LKILHGLKTPKMNTTEVKETGVNKKKSLVAGKIIVILITNEEIIVK